jgi:Cytochrome c oxidase subunit IV
MDDSGSNDPKGFSQPRPRHPPPATFWPFVTAMGLAMVFWGVTLNLLVVCVGIGVFVVGMSGLVGDWVREHRNEST